MGNFTTIYSYVQFCCLQGILKIDLSLARGLFMFWKQLSITLFILFIAQNSYLFSQDIIKPTRMATENQEAKEAPPEPAFGTLLGITLQPWAFWRSGQIEAIAPVGFDEKLDFNLDSNTFTTYEGSLWHKSGLKLGVNLDVDNNIVGKLNKITGLLGFKKVSLRVSGGKITGTANWKGEPVPGQPETAEVDTKYISIDLLYSIWKSHGSVYVGISYTSYDMPMEIEGLIRNSKNQVTIAPNSAYDDNVKIQTYGIVFGFDSLNDAIKSGKEGFTLWAFTQDSIFAGQLKISDEGMRRLAAANPSYDLVDKNKFFVLGVQYDLTLGLGWTKKIGRSILGLGAGYNFSGRGFFSFTGYNDIADYPEREMVVDTYPYLIRHGFVVKGAFAY